MADFKIKSAAGTGNKTLIQGQDQSGSNYAIEIGDAGALKLGTITSGTFPVGHVIQTKTVTFNGTQTIGDASSTGTTFVQITNFSIAMTLSSSNNKLVGFGTVNIAADSRYSAIKLYKDGSIIVSTTADIDNRTAVLVSSITNDSNTGDTHIMPPSSFAFEYLPGDISSHTYTMLAGNTNSGNKQTFINRGDYDENAIHAHRGVSSWILMEVEV